MKRKRVKLLLYSLFFLAIIFWFSFLIIHILFLKDPYGVLGQAPCPSHEMGQTKFIKNALGRYHIWVCVEKTLDDCFYNQALYTTRPPNIGYRRSKDEALSCIEALATNSKDDDILYSLVIEKLDGRDYTRDLDGAINILKKLEKKGFIKAIALLEIIEKGLLDSWIENRNKNS